MSTSTNFFKCLFGFAEMDYISTKKELLKLCKFERNGNRERCLFEHASGQLSSGWHSTPSVQELRNDVAKTVKHFNESYPGVLSGLWKKHNTCTNDSNVQGSAVRAASDALPCRHVIGDAGSLHERYPRAIFQAASQFNLLEFISEDVVPENGVTHYVYDHTQGPACALACMAGTAYRNYLIHPALFHDANEETPEDVDPALRGQRASHQVNTLLDVERYLRNEIDQDETRAPYFQIRNGYFTPLSKIKYLSNHLKKTAEARGETSTAALSSLCDKYIISRLRVGLVEDATVTTPLHAKAKAGDASLHTVSQIYCSALSLSPAIARGTSGEAESVALLASNVLKGAYEGTLLFGVLRSLDALEHQIQEGKRTTDTLELPTVFLTKVGGGVFNNKPSWIKEAIDHALHSVYDFGVPMDVALVHFGSVDQTYL